MDKDIRSGILLGSSQKFTFALFFLICKRKRYFSCLWRENTVVSLFCSVRRLGPHSCVFWGICSGHRHSGHVFLVALPCSYRSRLSHWTLSLVIFQVTLLINIQHWPPTLFPLMVSEKHDFSEGQLISLLSYFLFFFWNSVSCSLCPQTLLKKTLNF